MVSAPGIGSGLDINSLVEQLVAAERLPVSNRINLAEVRTNAELSALGKLKSAVAAFQDALEPLKSLDTFQERTLSLDTDGIIEAQADSTAAKGVYDIEVNSLATAQRLVSGVFASEDTAVGTGVMTISVGAESFAVGVADEANTLADIRDAINAAPDNVGLSASIVTADDGARLILSATATGAANQIVISNTGGDGGLDALNYDVANPPNGLSELQAASDASVDIDGFTISSASNTIDGAVQGLTIDLLAAAPGQITRVTVDFDQTAANDALQKFVDAYNDLATTIDELTSFDAESGIAGALQGDSIVRNLESSLRRSISSVVDLENSPFSVLSEIGITSNIAGKLEIDTVVSAAAIAANFNDVGRLFADASSGIAIRIDATLSTLVEEEGLILVREDGLKERLNELEEQREALDERMLLVEERLFGQFQALDILLAQFQSTSTFLSQQLANLPKPQPQGNSNS